MTVGSSYQLLLAGTPVDTSVYPDIATLEVEENAELPGALQFDLPVDSANNDLTRVGDDLVQPYANLAVVVLIDGQSPECIFDGYVLSNKLHLEKGLTNCKLQIWAQDDSWQMNQAENVHEWSGMTDGEVANAIFATYNFTPAPENTDDDSVTHPDTGHTLMQRATDIQFLRQLARRNGKLCRVACTDTPGQPTGYFITPDVTADPAVTLIATGTDPLPTVNSLDFEWDVTRATEVTGRQATFDSGADPEGVVGDATDSGLTAMDVSDLPTFAAQPMTALLTTTVDDAGELLVRAQSVVREGGFFVRCTGEADVSQINAVLRVGTVVQINGAGSMYSGNYFVWSVRHTIKTDSHKMNFVLVKNAIGALPTGPVGLP
jgi:hypothetical protein